MKILDMINLSLTFEPDNNLLRLNGKLVSLHCHYFNCGLLKALEEIPYINAVQIFCEEAANQFHLNFKQLMAETEGEISWKAWLEEAAELYRFLGYGRLKLDGLTKEGGTALADSSYYVVGWLARYGRRSTPVCHFTCGFLSGIMSAVFDMPVGHYEVEETECMMLGARTCKFIVSEKKDGG